MTTIYQCPSIGNIHTRTQPAYRKDIDLIMMTYWLMLLGALMLGKGGARKQQCKVTTIVRRPAQRVTHAKKLNDFV
jgi:hypothetical protein